MASRTVVRTFKSWCLQKEKVDTPKYVHRNFEAPASGDFLNKAGWIISVWNLLHQGVGTKTRKKLIPEMPMVFELGFILQDDSQGERFWREIWWWSLDPTGDFVWRMRMWRSRGSPWRWKFRRSATRWIKLIAATEKEVRRLKLVIEKGKSTEKK